MEGAGRLGGGHTSSRHYVPLPWQLLLAGFCLGCLAIQWAGPCFAALLLLLVLCRYYGRRPPRAWAVCLAFAAGFVWAGIRVPTLLHQDVPHWAGKRIAVGLEGDVSEVEGKTGNRTAILLSRVRWDLPDEHGLLPGRLAWTWLDCPDPPVRGERVRFTAVVKPVHSLRNFDGIDRDFAWQLQDVFFRTFTRGAPPHYEVVSRTTSLRTELHDRTLRLAPSSQGGAMLLALLLGDRSKVSFATQDLVQSASLAHTLALSGLHVGMASALGLALACLIGRVRPGAYLLSPRPLLAFYLAAPLVLGYMWLGGWPVTMVRAGLMLFCAAAFSILGQARALLDGVCTAVAAIVLFAPLSLLDPSLQLSATAVLGIAIFLPFLMPWVNRGPGIRRFLAGTAAVTLCATAVLLPLTAWLFGRVSPHLWLNLLWVPVLGVWVLPLGLIGVAAALFPGTEVFSGSMLHLAAWPCDLLLMGLKRLQDAGMLDMSACLRPTWPAFLGYGLLLLGGVLMLAGSKRPLWPVLLGAFLLLGWPWAYRAVTGADRLELTLLDVGQGQAVLLEGPKARVLVDGGGSWDREFDMGRWAVAPTLTAGKAPRLDWIVVTHADLDHMRGVYSVLREFSVARFGHNGRLPTGWDGEQLREALKEAGIFPERLQGGDALDLGGGYRLEVLHPRDGDLALDDNNAGVVFLLAKEDAGLALLPADLGMEGIEALLSRNERIRADILLLPHHGSAKSLHPGFYDRVRPGTALASAGFMNVYRHPSGQVIEALRGNDIDVAITSELGAIRLTWRTGSDRSVLSWARRNRPSIVHVQEFFDRLEGGSGLFAGDP